MLKRAVMYGLIYVALSLSVEVVLLVVFRLKVPQDNRIIAPVVLTVPPLAAAWLARRPDVGAAALLGVLTAVLTVVVTVVVTRVTGKSIGLLEPMLSRPMAGLLAAMTVGLSRPVGKPRANDQAL